MFLAEAGCVFMGFILCISGVQGQANSICALKGSSVDLPCSAEHPFSSRKWFTLHWDGFKYVRNEVSADGNHVTYMSKESHPTLTIKDLRESDAQLYCCTENIENQKDCLRSLITLHVTGLEVKLNPAVVKEGQRVTLSCNTSCPLTDNTNYIWYLNSLPLMVPERQNKHLVLDPVSIQHAGIYSCAVKTNQYIISGEKTLTVESTSGTSTAAAASIIAVLLVIMSLAVFFWIRRKRSSRDSPRFETSDNMENMEQLTPVPEYENISAQTRQCADTTSEWNHNTSLVEFPGPMMTMAMESNKYKISKYDEIISKSVLVQSGSPAVYQLKPRRKMTGGLTKMTVGENQHYKTNKTILLVGETGTGKSTLINALVNYTMGVKFEDNIWFEIVEDEKRSQAQSQTSDVIVYEIFGFEGKTLPFSLTIIDTPGYGDTRGTEKDAIVSQRLFDLFRSQDGVHEIDAVGLVLKASENRLSDRLKYVFDSVVSLFGKDIEKNIITLITHSDGMPPNNALQALHAANIKCAKNERNQPVYFLFNNCQRQPRDENTQVPLENAWRQTLSGMSRFSQLLEKIPPQKLKITLEVLNSRIRLTACIHNLQERIISTENAQREIQQTRTELNKNRKDLENDENFTIGVDEHYKDLVSYTGGWSKGCYDGVTRCTKCEENCHYPGCSIAWKASLCEVMSLGKCTVCRQKCSASDHEKDQQRYVTKTRKAKKTLQQLKDQYKAKVKNAASLLELLQRKMEALEAEKTRLLDEAYYHVVQLEQIALNVNAMSTHAHLDYLIEKMMERGDTEKVQKLKKMANQVDEGTKNMLSHFFGKPKEQRENHDPSSVKLSGPIIAMALESNKYKISKYDEIISKSVLVQSGSPAVYQLKPRRKMTGGLTKMTVGENQHYKTNKTILLVGETGTGKSTLINALVNYTMGVKFEDNIWFEIVEDEKRSQAQSQTSDVIVYEIFGFEGKTLPFSLTIIDTPGYGDTRGTEKDAIVSQRLFDLFRSQDGVHEIDAVGLVLKASENRLSDRLKYVFDSVVSLFGKDIEKNIITLITHSDGMPPNNALQALHAANIKCAKNERNQPVYFLFNNCQRQPRDENTQVPLENAWRQTLSGMSRFSQLLEKIPPQKLKITLEVLNSRIRLTACIHNLQERIISTENAQREIQQTRTELNKNRKDLENDENFTIGVDEHYKDLVSYTGGWSKGCYDGVTRCTKCEENCHYPGCSIAWKASLCEVMSLGKCTVCRQKCSASDHEKDQQRYVTKTRKAKKTLQQLKDQYKAKVKNAASLLELLQRKMEALEAEKTRLLDEAYYHVVQLEQIALNVNAMSTHAHLDYLIEKMMERGDTEKVQKLKKMANQVDEGTKNMLSHYYGKPKEQRK